MPTYKFINISSQTKPKHITDNPQNYSMMEPLTEDGVTKLLSIESGMNESFIVNLTNPKRLKNKILAFTISDGVRKFKGIIQINQPSKDIEALMRKRKTDELRVKISEHITQYEDGNPIFIEIVGFSVTGEAKKKKPPTIKLQPEISAPLKLQICEDDDETATSRTPPPNNPHPLLIKTESDLQTIIKQTKRSNSMQSSKRNNHRKEKLQQSDNQKQNVPPVSNHIPHQLIVDLYQSYYNWELVVRLVDANYKEFISKKGQSIKLLTVELIDKEGYKINGNFFGESALRIYNQLKNGSIYRIVRGKIIEDKYNTHKKQKQSKFCIQFTKDSRLSLIEDDPEIPYCRNNWIRLSQINSHFDSEENYNFIAILADIEQPRQLPRPDKSIFLQSLRVGDPITKVVHRVNIWNHQIVVDPNLLGKSILLKKFRISKFKDEVNLNATVHSQIICHNFFAEHQGNCNFFINPRQCNSPIKLLKQLSDELTCQAVNVSIVSTIQVWIKEMGFDKKWFYDACPNPKCRKSCNNTTSIRCSHCDMDLYECSKRYILQVRLTDITGSIWVTAFDESANVFLKQIPMQALFPMTNKELCEYADSHYCYEQYRVQISSKRDMLGMAKHTIIGKPVKMNPTETAQSNLKRIMLLSRQLDILQSYD